MLAVAGNQRGCRFHGIMAAALQLIDEASFV